MTLPTYSNDGLPGFQTFSAPLTSTSTEHAAGAAAAAAAGGGKKGDVSSDELMPVYFGAAADDGE